MRTLNLFTLFFLISLTALSQEVVKYNLFNTSPLISKEIYSVEAFGDDVYVCQGMSVTKFNGDTYVHILANSDYRYIPVNDILILENDEMWITTPFALLHAVNGEFESIESINSIDFGVSYRLEIDQSERIWLSTSEGLFMLEGDVWTHFDEGDGVLPGRASAITVDGSDVWVAFRDSGNTFGVSMLDGETWTNYTSENGLIGTSVRDICIDSYSFVWFCTDEGVAKYTGNNWEYFTKENSGLASNIVNCMQIDTNGNYWFGTFPENDLGGGVSKFDSNIWETYSIDDGLISNKIVDMTYTDNNQLWIGTFYSGVSVINLNSWGISLGKNIAVEGLNDFNIFSGYIDNDNNFWFQGNRNLTSFDGQEWVSYLKSDFTIGYSTSVFSEDENGDLLFLGGDNLAIYNGDTWSQIPETELIGSSNYFDAVSDSESNLWLATLNGVCRKNESDWTMYTTTDNLLDNYTQFIDIDSAENVWCVSYNLGISKFDQDIWTSFQFPENYLPGYITDFALDQNNKAWLSTSQDGVYSFDGENWTRYDTTNGLNDNYVQSLEVDLDNNIWIGQLAIHKFDGENWTDIDLDGGLTEDYNDYGIGSITVDQDNNLWLTGNACIWKIIQSNNLDIDDILSKEISCFLYPNPTIHNVNIEFEGEQVNIKTFTSTGKLVDDISASSSPATIDISNYSEGTYIFEIIQGAKKSTSKLIVTH